MLDRPSFNGIRIFLILVMITGVLLTSNIVYGSPSDTLTSETYTQTPDIIINGTGVGKITYQNPNIQATQIDQENIRFDLTAQSTGAAQDPGQTFLGTFSIANASGQSKYGSLYGIQPNNQGLFEITGFEEADMIYEGLFASDAPRNTTVKSINLLIQCGENAPIEYAADNGDIGSFTGNVLCQGAGLGDTGASAGTVPTDTGESEVIQREPEEIPDEVEEPPSEGPLPSEGPNLGGGGSR